MKIENESKSYDKCILKNISLEIDKGIYRVEGENGSGKSTLLQLLAGLETFDSGLKNCVSKDVLYLDTNQLGVVPFTIEENLQLLCDSFQIHLSFEDKEQINTFFDNKIGDNYMTASTGTKFKLGLSLIFAKNWDYIFIDETLSTVDARSIDMIAKHLISMKESSTIIYVSHNLLNQELISKSQRILIEEGRVYEISNK
ncbi:ABC transporter ATP-binding protein [Streptococcus pneumoniae]|nr:ABC transporter ATP-binding protein [Streptococcus pneumoniae]